MQRAQPLAPVAPRLPSRYTRFLVAGLMSSIIAPPPELLGQSERRTTQTIDDRPACSACSFRWSRRVRIGTEDADGAIAEPNRLARDSRNRYYVTAPALPGEIKVFDGAGKYLRSLAGRGRGPGEVMGAPVVHVSADDTIHVFDLVNARYTIYDPDHRRARETRLAVPVSSVAATRNALAVAAAAQVRGEWRPLHLLSRNGDLIASVGEPDYPVRAESQFLLWRTVASSRDNGFWAAPTHADYRVELRDSSGALVRRFNRTADWFTPSGPDAVLQWRPGVTPPPAILTGLREDAEGRLWVAALVPAANWQRAYEQSPAADFMLFESVLEVIDTTRGVVIARERIPRYVRGFVGEDVFTYHEDENGLPVLEVWRVELLQSPG